MKKIFLISLFAIISFSGCKKSKDIISEDITSEVIFLKWGWDGFFEPCFNSLFDSEIVIRNQDVYKELFESNRREGFPDDNCDDVPPPEIDFNKYSLIGKRTLASGCDQEYKRTIIKTGNKTIKYYIVVISKGGCMPLVHEMNWALVPKIEHETEVFFDVKEIYEF